MGQGDLRFIRNVAFGGKDITNEIAEMYDIDFDTAELIKGSLMFGKARYQYEKYLKKLR